MRLGEKIREARIKNNLSQADLANKLFVSKQSISKYENNKAKPSKEVLDKIASILDIDLKDEQIDNNKKLKEKFVVVLSFCTLFMIISTVLFIQNRNLVRKLNVYEEVLDVKKLDYHGLEITYLNNELNDYEQDELWIKISVYNSNDEQVFLNSDSFFIKGIDSMIYLHKSRHSNISGYSRIGIQPNEAQTYFLRIKVNDNSLRELDKFYLIYGGEVLVRDTIS